MSSVLVGMFDSQADADRARTQLMAAGFAADSITMTGGTSQSESASQASSSGGQQEEGVISRFFQDLFGSDDRSSRDGGYRETYQEAFRRGSFGVRVSALDDDEVDRAERILNAAGAVDVDERAQSWRQEGWSGGAADYESSGGTAGAMGAMGSTGRMGTTGSAGTSGNTGTTGTTGTTMGTSEATALDAGATRTLKEVEEELKVGKRTVARGGVRIFSRVVEVPVEESVTLREERAEVTRRAVDRPATEADLAAFTEGSIEVRESAEEAVVSKSARVIGEVEVGKTVTEREETVRDTVRQTRVDVEEIEAGRGGSAGASIGALSPQREAAVQGGGSMASGSMASGGMGSGSTGGGSMGTGSTGTGSGGLAAAGDLGSHPVATGTGAVAGGIATGAAVGTVAGPVGTAVGAAVGAVAGGLAGKGVAESVDDDEETETRKPL